MTLKVQNVSLSYGSLQALRNITFTVEEGERISIVGPSGCGKSTLLSLIAGLKPSTSGHIVHRGQVVEGPSRSRVVIFQNHALFPWATALANVEFALRARGFKGSLHDEAMKHLAEMGLDKFADRYPRELSGGMQQRVGLARALAADPSLLLFDEPFSSLDVLTRDRLLEDVLPALKSKTLILVTHNIEEALFFGDRVLCLSPQPGQLVQELVIPGAKPRRLIDYKRQPDFQKLETQLYGWLSGQEDINARARGAADLSI